MSTTDATVGLFGTCGGSKWRDPFIEKFKSLDIPFFNPVVPNWTKECAVEEARHLAEDEVILFPVTSETFGMGSLAETGFSVLQALKTNVRREICVYVAPKVDQVLFEQNPSLARESDKARALVAAHLKEAQKTTAGLWVVNSMEKMLEISGMLYSIAAIRKSASSIMSKE